MPVGQVQRVLVTGDSGDRVLGTDTCILIISVPVWFSVLWYSWGSLEPNRCAVVVPVCMHLSEWGGLCCMTGCPVLIRCGGYF